MRRRVIGIVTRDKTLKTRRVEVERSYRHPKYGKTLRTRTICYTHDEDNTSHIGDLVEIIECRPMSRLKRWRLVKVVRANKVATPVAPATAVVAEPAPAAN
ncbi:MAG: 30S ribosomal protein S17 [Planctomycetota bacterium]|nr:30S ribosomal protein S17 [Planctomycetota bacterium]